MTLCICEYSDTNELSRVGIGTYIIMFSYYVHELSSMNYMIPSKYLFLKISIWKKVLKPRLHGNAKEYGAP